MRGEQTDCGVSRVRSAGCGLPGAECRVWLTGCGVPGAGYRVRGAGCRLAGWRRAGCRLLAPGHTPGLLWRLLLRLLLLLLLLRALLLLLLLLLMLLVVPVATLLRHLQGKTARSNRRP